MVKHSNFDGLFEEATKLILKSHGQKSKRDKQLLQVAYITLKALADAGHAPSQYEVSLAYDDYGFFGVNRKASMKYALLAAKRGYSPAFNSVGFNYFHGRGVKKNKVVARRWFKKGAEAGELTAILNHAQEVKSLKEKKFWLRKGAKAGDSDAMVELGKLLLITGKRSEAEKWFGKALKGYTLGEAEVELAKLELARKTPDRKRAKKLLREAVSYYNDEAEALLRKEFK